MKGKDAYRNKNRYNSKHRILNQRTPLSNRGLQLVIWDGRSKLIIHRLIQCISISTRTIEYMQECLKFKNFQSSKGIEVKQKLGQSSPSHSPPKSLFSSRGSLFWVRGRVGASVLAMLMRGCL